MIVYAEAGSDALACGRHLGALLTTMTASGLPRGELPLRIRHVSDPAWPSYRPRDYSTCTHFTGRQAQPCSARATWHIVPVRAAYSADSSMPMHEKPQPTAAIAVEPAEVNEPEPQ